MTDVDELLQRCFLAAFPDVDTEHLQVASVETLTEWDSLHALILFALLEETFEIRIPARDYPLLRSYTSVRGYLQDQQIAHGRVDGGR